jgi:hypothetical protein
MNLDDKERTTDHSAAVRPLLAALALGLMVFACGCESNDGNAPMDDVPF